jgi:hypothetical protein
VPLFHQRIFSDSYTDEETGAVVNNPFKGDLKRLYMWVGFILQLCLIGRAENVGDKCPAVEDLVRTSQGLAADVTRSWR